MKALVTGGLGFIGSHLTRGLLKRGYEVRNLVFVDDRKKNVLFDLNMELFYGDITNKNSLIEAIKGIDFIYHLAGLPGDSRAPEEAFERVNFYGTKNLLEVCFQENPNIKRIIFASSDSAVGPSYDGTSLNEACACHPTTAYGLSKYHAELEAMRFMKKLPIVIIRPPLVYGPGDRRMLKYFMITKKRVKLIIGSGESRMSFCYVENLIDGFILAAESENAAGKVFFIADESPCTWNEFVDNIASALGIKTIGIKVPVVIAKNIILIYNWLAKAVGVKPMITTENIMDMDNNRWICDISKAQQELGYAAKVKLRQGLRITANWYKRHKWI